MEIRYVAPFLFLEFVGFAALLRFDGCTQVHQTRVVLEAFALTIFLSVNVCLSAVDQSFRALSGTREKVSHRTVFVESVSLGDFLKKFGIGKGDEVAIFWPPGGPIYWARVIGVRLTADITDAKDFLNLTAEERLSVLKALQGAGIKALVAKGQAFAGLESEGWLKPQETSNYYVYILDRSGHRAVKNTF
jgi:hypothetical protein